MRLRRAVVFALTAVTAAAGLELAALMGPEEAERLATVITPETGA